MSQIFNEEELKIIAKLVQTIKNERILTCPYTDLGCEACDMQDNCEAYKVVREAEELLD